MPDFDIEMPAALQPLAYLAGQAWPGPPASESRMSWISGYLHSAADELEALIPQLGRVRTATSQVLVGETGAAADRQFAMLFDGPYSVNKLVEALRALGGLAETLSEQIQYVKLQIITMLGIAAATIRWALANADWTGGLSLSEIPAAEARAAAAIGEEASTALGRITEALGQVLSKTMVKQLVLQGGLVGAGIGGGQELAVEALQAALNGHGDIKLGQVLDVAFAMGVGGLAAGLTGHLVGAGLGPATELAAKVLKGALTGLASGETAMVAGALAGGGPMSLEMVVGGLIGVVHGVPRAGAPASGEHASGAPASGEHAAAGHSGGEPAQGAAAAEGRPTAASAERSAGESGAAGEGAARSGEGGSAPDAGAAPPGVPAKAAGQGAGPASATPAAADAAPARDGGSAAVSGHGPVSGARADSGGPAKGGADAAVPAPGESPKGVGAGAGSGRSDGLMGPRADEAAGPRAGAVSDDGASSGRQSQKGRSGVAESGVGEQSAAKPAGAAAARSAETPAAAGAGGERVAGGRVEPTGEGALVRGEGEQPGEGPPVRGDGQRPDGGERPGEGAGDRGEGRRLAAVGTDRPPGRPDGGRSDGGTGRGPGRSERGRWAPVADRGDGPSAGRDSGRLEGGGRSDGRGGVLAYLRDAWGRATGREGVAVGRDSTGSGGGAGHDRGSAGGRLRVDARSVKSLDPLAAADEVGLAAGRHGDAEGRVVDDGGGGGRGGVATDHAPAPRENCVLATGETLTEWYEPHGRDFHVEAEPDAEGRVPAREGFKAADSAADPVATLAEVAEGFEGKPVGSSAIVAVRWRWSAWAKFVNWVKGGSLDGAHMVLARKVIEGPDGIRFFDPKTGEKSGWPPQWGDKAVERIAVGYLDDTGKAYKSLSDTPGGDAAAREIGDAAGQPGVLEAPREAVGLGPDDSGSHQGVAARGDDGGAGAHGQRGFDEGAAGRSDVEAAAEERAMDPVEKKRAELEAEAKQDPQVQKARKAAQAHLKHARDQAEESRAAFESETLRREREFADDLRARVEHDERVVAAQEKLVVAEVESVLRQAERDGVASGLDADEQAAVKAGRWRELGDGLDPKVRRAAADFEASRGEVEEATKQRDAVVQVAIEEHRAVLDEDFARVKERAVEDMKAVKSAQDAYDAVLPDAVEERYTALQAEANERIAAADAERAGERAKAVARVEKARAARTAWEGSRNEYDARKADAEAMARGELRDSIATAEERVAEARPRFEECKALYEDEKGALTPREEVLERLRREFNDSREQLRSAMVAREALLRAAGDHGVELTAARAERNEVLSRWNRRGFRSEVAEREAHLRDLLAGQREAARDEAGAAEAQAKMEQLEAAYLAARIEHETALRQASEELIAVMHAAGEEHWLAHEREGLLDFEKANDGFSEQRAAAAKDAATALEELHKVLGLREATPARLREMLWGKDEIDRLLASHEIGRRFVSDDNPHVPDAEINVKYTQEMLALLLGTDVNGRAVSGDMGCGEGKSLTVMIYAVAKAAELAPLGKAVLVETTRSHLVSRSHTEYLQALREDYGIDVHFRDSADDPVPQLVPDRGLIILQDFNTEIFGHEKGHPSPACERILDEGDEGVIWSGGGDRVGTVYKLSRGAAEPASPEVAARFNTAAEFFSDNVESGDLTAAHFGIREGRDYGAVHVTEEGRATIQRLLDEQNTRNVGVDDVVKAAIGKYQYQRNIDYKVYYKGSDGKVYHERPDGKLYYKGSDGKAYAYDGSDAKLSGYVYLIDRVNGELRHDPETNSDVRITNDIHKALEAKENLVEKEAGRPGVTVRHDTESSVEITTQEYLNKVRSGDRTTTVSGSNRQAAKLMAKNYEGMGPVVSVEPFHPLAIKGHPDMWFDTQDAKLAWTGQQTKLAHENGQPVVIGCTRDDLCARQAAVLDKLGVPYRLVGDADYQHMYGASWREQMEADIAKAGEKGEVTIVAPTGARGSDYRVSDEVKELSKAGKMHGIKLFVTGRSGITDAIDVQFARRVGRNGDPGEVIFCLSRDDDAYTRSPDQDVQLAVTQFDKAAEAHAAAEAAHRADPGEQNTKTLADLKQARDAEADRLLKLIPTIQHNAQQHLSTPQPASPGHAPTSTVDTAPTHTTSDRAAPGPHTSQVVDQATQTSHTAGHENTADGNRAGSDTDSSTDKNAAPPTDTGADSTEPDNQDPIDVTGFNIAPVEYGDAATADQLVVFVDDPANPGMARMAAFVAANRPGVAAIVCQLPQVQDEADAVILATKVRANLELFMAGREDPPNKIELAPGPWGMVGEVLTGERTVAPKADGAQKKSAASGSKTNDARAPQTAAGSTPEAAARGNGIGTTPSKEEVSAAARQWARMLAGRLREAVREGVSGAAATVADRAEGVDVMDVAAVAEGVWRAARTSEGEAVPVRLVVDVGGDLVELVGEAIANGAQLQLLVVPRRADSALVERVRRAGVVVSLAQLVDGVARAWAGYGGSGVTLYNGGPFHHEGQSVIVPLFGWGCVLADDLSQAAEGLNSVAKFLVRARARQADLADSNTRGLLARRAVCRAVDRAIEHGIFDGANAGRVQDVARDLRALPPDQALDAQEVVAAAAVLDAIDARGAVLRAELSAEAMRATSQLHELKSVGGRVQAGIDSLTTPVLPLGATISFLDESADVVRRFLAEGDEWRRRVDEAMRRLSVAGASRADREAAAVVVADVVNSVMQQVRSRASEVVRVAGSVVEWLVPDTSAQVPAPGGGGPPTRFDGRGGGGPPGTATVVDGAGRIGENSASEGLPSSTVDDSTATAAAAEAGRDSAEQTSTLLLGAAQALAFAQHHYTQLGVTSQITLAQTNTVTSAQMANNIGGQATVGPDSQPTQSAPADGGWHDNPDIRGLFARVLDDTDSTELVFLAAGPSGPQQYGRVWVVTKENGQVLLHGVVEIPSATGRGATEEYDDPCSTEDDLADRIPPDTALHAIVLDRNGNLLPATGEGAVRAAGYHGGLTETGSPARNQPKAAGPDALTPWLGRHGCAAPQRGEKAWRDG